MFLLDTSFWEIKTTKEKGRGVFARNNIPPGTVIGDYIGTVIRPEDDDDTQTGLYGVCAHDTYVFFPDVASDGVHCMNASCMPNCAMYPYKGHILFIALRQIFMAEELTISYMIEPDGNSVGPTYTCYCDTPLCRGTMVVSREKAHTFWDVFVKKHMGKYYNNINVMYGTKLPTLSSYPTYIKDNDIYDVYGSLSHIAMMCEDTKLPEVNQLRSRIRESGKQLFFSRLGLTVMGIEESRCIITL